MPVIEGRAFGGGMELALIVNVLAIDDVAAGVASAFRALENGTERPSLVFRGE